MPDEDDHLTLLNEAIPVRVNRVEDHLVLLLVKVVGRRAIGEHVLEEPLGFTLVQGAAIVFVVVAPNFVDGLLIDALFLSVSRDPSSEGAIRDKDSVVNENLNVSREAFPLD